MNVAKPHPVALGWDASIFFTFNGLELVKKDLKLHVSPLGNPAMPMKMPFGPDWLKCIDMPIPTHAASLPGFENLATAMMEQTVKAKGVPSILELRDICVESGVRLVACQMTVDLFNFRPDELIPEIAEWIGATSYLAEARKGDPHYFIVSTCPPAGRDPGRQWAGARPSRCGWPSAESLRCGCAKP